MSSLSRYGLNLYFYLCESKAGHWTSGHFYKRTSLQDSSRNTPYRRQIMTHTPDSDYQRNLIQLARHGKNCRCVSEMKQYAELFAILITAPGLLDEVEANIHLDRKDFYEKHKLHICRLTDNWRKDDCRVLAAKLQEFMQTGC